MKTLIEIREEQKECEKESPQWYAFEGQILLITSMLRKLNKDWGDKIKQ